MWMVLVVECCKSANQTKKQSRERLREGWMSYSPSGDVDPAEYNPTSFAFMFTAPAKTNTQHTSRQSRHNVYMRLLAEGDSIYTTHRS